jgi:3,4-dihydroxy-2-butanone 4-phosphate synthase
MTSRLTAVRGARADDDSAGVQVALEALSGGRPVLFADEANNCGYLAQAAELASVEFVVLAATHGTGALRVVASGERLDRLGIPTFGAGAHRAPVDLHGQADGGVHAHRAATLRAFAAPDTLPGQLVAPGQVFPAAAGECLTLDDACAGRTMLEAMRLAGLEPVAAYTQVVDEQGRTADRMATGRLARRLGLTLVSMREVLIRREQLAPRPERLVETTIPTPEGPFRAIGYRGERTGHEYVAFVAGPLQDGIRVHVHRRCMMSDVFGGADCGCGEQLRSALTEIRHAGSGVVLYHCGAEDLPCAAADGHHRRPAGWATTVEVSAIVADLGARRVFLSANEVLEQRDLAALGLDVIESSGADWFGVQPARRAAAL